MIEHQFVFFWVQVHCCTYCCTAVLLYVVKAWSVGGWRVHCVVRGGWVGRLFSFSVGDEPFFLVYKISAFHWCLRIPPSPLLHTSVLYY